MGVVSIDWFKSYLADKHLVVNINVVISSPGYVKVGVPQGSILGPLQPLSHQAAFPLHWHGVI